MTCFDNVSESVRREEIAAIRILRAAALAALSAAQFAAWFAAMPAQGRTLTALELDGYLVRRVLSVDGDFRGCDRAHPIRFVGGGDFQCQAQSFTYLRQPLAFVLQNPATLDTVLTIGGVEYDGRLENVPRLGRRVDTGTGPLIEPPGPVQVRLMPDQAEIGTQPVTALQGLGEPEPPGHDNGTPQPR